MILTSLQKLPNNVGDLGKIIVATGFEWLPKVQKIAQSGHTGVTYMRHMYTHPFTHTPSHTHIGVNRYKTKKEQSMHCCVHRIDA